MLVSRCFGLCALCSRVVHSSGGRRAARRTLAGHAGAEYVHVTQVRHGGTVAPTRLYHSDLGHLYGTESVQRHVRRLVEEFGDISQMLQLSHLSESDRKVLLKKHAELLPVADAFESTEQALKDLEEVTSLLHGKSVFCFRQLQTTYTYIYIYLLGHRKIHSLN